MAAACCYQADGTCAELVFGMRAGSYDEDSLIGFVEELHTHLAGKKVTLLWDGLPSHRSKKMKGYIASQRRWLVVERLPAYVLPSSIPSRSSGPT
jgi:putative transposase